VADFFIDLGDIAELIRKDSTQGGEYEVPSFIPPDEMPVPDVLRGSSRDSFHRGPRPGSNRQSNTQEKNPDLVRVNDDQ
jgi:hypothetical protein